jgi:hypothetical protein
MALKKPMGHTETGGLSFLISGLSRTSWFSIDLIMISGNRSAYPWINRTHGSGNLYFQ